MKIYTDGSCKGNGRKSNVGSYGFIAVKSEKIDMAFAKRAYSTTNNKMELMALYTALRYIRKCKLKETTIISDSKYVVDGYSAWIEKWVRNGWKTHKGNEVLNKPIWKKLYAIKEELSFLNLQVNLEWTKAHGTNKFNNYIDNLITTLTK